MTGITPAKFVCLSESFVAILYSYNVTVRNLIFTNCNGNLSYFHAFSPASSASLVFLRCFSCAVKDVVFLEYGFAGIDTFGQSYLDNININTSSTATTFDTCSPKVLFVFLNATNYHNDNLITMNKLYITGHSKICVYHCAIYLHLLQNQYSVNIKVYNSDFYDMDQAVLYIRVAHSDHENYLLINNCKFTNIKTSHLYTYEMIIANVPIVNMTISFVDCEFYSNKEYKQLIVVNINDIDGLCPIPTNVSIINCSFANNEGNYNLLYFKSINTIKCIANLFISGITHFFGNTNFDSTIHISAMAVHLKGNIILSNNNAFSIMYFDFCDITFAKTVALISNNCNQLIKLRSAKTYITIMEYSVITFAYYKYHHHTFSIETMLNEKIIFPLCFFQYTTTKNAQNILQENFVIDFVSNEIQQSFLDYLDTTIYDLLSHCKWLPTAAFYGKNPSEINQQIIKIDGKNWSHHNKICYCYQNGTNNCNIDVLGPLYPGQTIQVDLCIPDDTKHYYTVYTETHAASLPNSACKIVHQNQYINKVGNYSKTINFTVSSESHKACELFLTLQPYVKTSNAFYVELLPCPIGFTLQNGICYCDPLLPNIIQTCNIDQLAIRRPANTWITTHTTQLNNTEYLISDCPLDYCLPHSSNVNLLYPDLQCQFNRTGVLCSKCQQHLSMVFGSSRCLKCTNIHILITLIILVAGIILVVLLYLLNLTVTNGTINGIIFYANIISINDSVFLVNDDVFRPLQIFISFANLDLGIETCFYHGMDSYVKVWLQLFFPIYLTLIAFSIIIASRYSTKLLQLTFARSLPVLATLFLLSYTSVLRVVLTVLFSYSIITYHPSKHQQVVWSIDSSIPLLGFKFILLFITCLVLFLLLVPFNITLLFTTYLSRFKVINHLKPLLDAFHGSYKDMYYYWIAVHIILRSLLFILNIFNLKTRLIITTIILLFFTSYYGYIRPHKNKLIHIQELILLINLIIMYAVSYQDNSYIFSAVTNIMISLAVFQLCIIVLYHFLTYTIHFNIITRFKAVKEKIYVCVKKPKRYSNDIALLNIPECTYNYTEYRDGLVSDHFK